MSRTQPSGVVKVTFSEQWQTHYVYGPEGGFSPVRDRAYHESCIAMHQKALELIEEMKQ